MRVYKHIFFIRLFIFGFYIDNLLARISKLGFYFRIEGHISELNKMWVGDVIACRNVQKCGSKHLNVDFIILIIF